MTLSTLRELLNQQFDTNELRQLCFDLAIEYENLPGETRAIKAQALIAHCLRHQHLPELLQQCTQLRPKTSWPAAELLAAQWEALQQEISVDRQKLAGAFPEDTIDLMLAPLREKKESAFLTQQFGSGAIAQGDGATAWGQGAVDASGATVGGSIVTGSVSAAGDLAMRDLHKTWNVINHVVPETDKREAELTTAYLSHILRRANFLPLSGIDPQVVGDAAQTRLSLAAVYTALLTSDGEGDGGLRVVGGMKSDGRRSSALAMLDRYEKLVLLGEPGSGKSAFVHFVAACLAGEWQGHAEANLARLVAPLPDEKGNPEDALQPWHQGKPLPLLVTLRDFAARGLPASALEPATAQHLWQFITQELEAALLGEYAPLLQARLRQEGGLLLLDGLDEVPEAERRREQMKEAVLAFVAAFPRLRVLVTSRTYAYQKQAWQLPDFHVALLAPFSAGQIRHFIRSWYAYMAQVRGLNSLEMAARAELLQHTIFANERLQALAERPLLLTLMASLHAWRGGELPQRRAELYANTVDLLLYWWEKPKMTPTSQGVVTVLEPSLLEWLKIDREQMRRLLNRLAFTAHAEQPELTGTADIREETLVTELVKLADNPDVRPQRLVEYLSQRAGLLVTHGNQVYTFPHRTFQEYLAACHLTDEEYPDQIADLARQEPDRWREVVLLAGAKAATGSADNIWQLAEALCDNEEVSDDLPALWGAQLAGQALAETANLQQVSKRHQPKLARVRRWLVHLLGQPAFPALERVRAGISLGILGDPRRELLDVDEMTFAYIPGGPFLMGSDDPPQSDDPVLQEIYESQRPQHEVLLPDAYWLARYPVTHVQFSAFVQAGGYEQADYWPEAAAAGIWQAGQVRGHTWIPEKREFEEISRNSPYDYGMPFNLPNHPVVAVTWYEALAFCRWLTQRWANWLPQGYGVWLPSEAEWEKGARGGLSLPVKPRVQPISELRMAQEWASDLPMQANPLPARPYPWGDEAVSGRHANGGVTDVDSTSTPGCFVRGQSPYGCAEMSGNVWEWTRSLYSKWQQGGISERLLYPYVADGYHESLTAGIVWARVFCGGGWGNSEDWLRCSYRGGFDPDFGSVDLGFRICVSPFSSPAL